MKILAASAVLVGVLCLGSAAAEPVAGEWIEGWAEDLRYLRAQIPEVHPSPYDNVSREELGRSFDELIARLPRMQHHEVVVALVGLIARLRDGHSRVTLPLPEDVGVFLGHSPTPLPEVPGLVFRHLPIRFYRFADGLHVLRIGAENGFAAGWRVTAIGGRPVDDVLETVGAVVHHDNEMQLRYQLPDFLVIPEVLHATGIVASPEQVSVAVEAPEGKTDELALRPVERGDTVAWVDARPAAVEAPLYLGRIDEHFWFEYLEDSRTVYWQYNTVYPTENETTRQFADRLFGFIERNEVERLVIDLRGNRGGDNSLNRPLLHGLIRCDKLQRPGSLFVIVGRGTFSAAMMFAIDLEEHTNALFVGELTGATLNHYGDSRKLRLPRSGLTVRLSTLYWQYSDPRDRRRGIAPHLPTELSAADYRQGRDPALRAILAGRGAAPSLAGRWQGLVTLGIEDYDVGLELRNDAGTWSGTVNVAGTPLQNLPLTELRVLEGQLTARFAVGEQVLDLIARVADGRLFGSIGDGASAVPFALSK